MTLEKLHFLIFSLKEENLAAVKTEEPNKIEENKEIENKEEKKENVQEINKSEEAKDKKKKKKILMMYLIDRLHFVKSVESY